MIKHNKYWKIYNQIIDKALSENRSKKNAYYENHHIVPRSIRPDLEKDKNNQVLLTAREHYICHYLLTKFTTGVNNDKMIYSFHLMQFSQYGQRKIFNSLLYEKNKIKMSNLRKGKKLPESQIKNMLKSRKKYFENGGVAPMKGKKHSEETKKRMSESRKTTLGNGYVEIYGPVDAYIRRDKLKKSMKKRDQSGSKNPMYNKKHTQKCKNEMSKNMKRYKKLYPQNNNKNPNSKTIIIYDNHDNFR